MKKIYILAPLIGAFILSNAYCAERSAFGAGDVESSSPYGLTESEKVLLKNKEQVESMKNDVNELKNKVGSLEEQVEGIRSVLDGTSSRTNEIDNRIRSLEGKSISDANSSQIEQLHVYMNENRKVENQNNAKVTKVLKELSSLIDSINANYVPKAKFNALEKRLNALEGKKTSSASSQTSLSKKSGKSLLAGGKKLVSAGKLNEAKQYFQASVKKRYKPAESNYRLGEISYVQKSWADAISYYKTSVELYDKASYMSRLLYHTAISFDKLGDRENANKFYQALKSNYPNSKEAKAAPDRK